MGASACSCYERSDPDPPPPQAQGDRRPFVGSAPKEPPPSERDSARSEHANGDDSPPRPRVRIEAPEAEEREGEAELDGGGSRRQSVESEGVSSTGLSPVRTRLAAASSFSRSSRKMRETQRGSLLGKLSRALHEEDVVDSLDAGQTGGVYTVKTPHKSTVFAVFKPQDKENFERRGIPKGQGAMREEAAYLLDRLVGNKARVPVSTLTKVPRGMLERTNLPLQRGRLESTDTSVDSHDAQLRPEDTRSFSGFVSSSAPGSLLGKGHDAQLATLSHGFIGGAFIAAGAGSVAASMVRRKAGHEPSRLSAQWLACCVDGQHFKIVELEVVSSRGVLYVRATSAKCKSGYTDWQGNVCEEANAIVSACGDHEGVPVATSPAGQGYGVLDVDFHEEFEVGSIQRFVKNVVGSAEDFGMPRDLTAATGTLSIKDVQQVASLDLRLCNTDRHSGNLLFTENSESGQQGGPRYIPVPIDHGCTLPRWWAMGEANFEAWLDWPQARAPCIPEVLEVVEHAKQKLDEVLDELENLGIEAAARATHQIALTMLHEGVVRHGLSLAAVASLMGRDSCDPCDPSWLEERMAEIAADLGVAWRWEENRYGDKVVAEPDDPASAPPDAFIERLEALFADERAMPEAANKLVF